MSPYLKNRLGEILVEKGFITSEQLHAAIKDQKNYRQRMASAAQVIDLKKQHPLVTIACTDEIQRAHRENQHYFSLDNSSITCTDRESFTRAANDSDYDSN